MLNNKLEKVNIPTTEGSLNSFSTYERTLNEFEKSLKVNNISALNLPRTRYQHLDRTMSETLNNVLSNYLKINLNNFKEINGAEGFSNSGAPFKCFSRINGEGNFIVADNKVIETYKKNDANYDYSETRREKNGDRKINIHTSNGVSRILIIDMPDSMTNKAIRDFEVFANFFVQPRKGMEMEMGQMTNEEKATYVLELQRLGIKPQEDSQIVFSKLSAEQIDMRKQKGDVLRTFGYAHTAKTREGIEKIFDAVQFVDNEETPRAIWTVIQTSTEDKPNGKMFRRTSEGNYLDSSSVKFVNGKPKYVLQDYEEIMEELAAQGYDKDAVKLARNKITELTDKLPQEVESIYVYAEKQKEVVRETQVYEEDLIPGYSSRER